MKPVFQTKFGGSEAPESEQGNCMAACLASIFELSLEDVPDFSGNIANGVWYGILSNWLAKRNLALHFPALNSGAPPGIQIMEVKSTTLSNPDDGHVVVIENGNVVHDPNPRAKAVGERISYWTFVVIDPALTKVIKRGK
tara:strand:+ start:271 stop:690 length:420 start_codon:yes stop_codon:yes gene_type:complete